MHMFLDSGMGSMFLHYVGILLLVTELSAVFRGTFSDDFFKLGMKIVHIAVAYFSAISYTFREPSLRSSMDASIRT